MCLIYIKLNEYSETVKSEMCVKEEIKLEENKTNKIYRPLKFLKSVHKLFLHISEGNYENLVYYS